jgi:hypothetical protein
MLSIVIGLSIFITVTFVLGLILLPELFGISQRDSRQGDAEQKEDRKEDPLDAP